MSDRLSQLLRVAELSVHAPTAFALTFDEAGHRRIADALSITSVKKLRFSGRIEAYGGRDWRLVADLGATVIQPCVISLDPVTTRLDERIERTYLAEMPEISGAEVEIPDDDTIDEIPEFIDLEGLMLEALALSLPPFPRSSGAELGQFIATEPGKDAMTDDDAKPFSGLGALRDALEQKKPE